ncbi:MAG: TIGR03571 family LLM class oxidoreductase [Actinomycetota bacterium]
MTASTTDEPNVIDPTSFASINRGYDAVFRPGRLSVGLVAPIEAYGPPVPTMERHVERVQLAERLGFSAVWLRDVPFNVDSFGDAGQVHDPFVYLGLLAGATGTIALGVASIILPLRHPAHVAKAAASADVLSGGRLILGVASGDRPDEFPAMKVPFDERGARFRDAFDYLSRMADRRPHFESSYGAPSASMDLLPKPTGGRLPLMVTGSSRQSSDWIAGNGDGWMTYPRANAAQQQHAVAGYRAGLAAAGRAPLPVMQPLYIDLADDPGERLRPIHLGYRLGVDRLVDHLRSLERIGINHVALNLRFNQAPVERSLEVLADRLIPAFPS